MVVAHHLVVEDLALEARRVGDEVLLEDLEDLVAHALELLLNVVLVRAHEVAVVLARVALRVLLVLECVDDPPRRPPGADHILVRDGEETGVGR